MKKIWFKAKEYGYGWYPATWQGWAIIAVFIILIVANFYRIDSNSHSVSDTLINFIPETSIMVGVLIGICAATGEKARFRWGNKEKK